MSLINEIEKIKNSDAFVALITKNYIEEKGITECLIANKFRKPLFAVVQDDIANDFARLYGVFEWDGIYFFKAKEDFEEIIKKIKEKMMGNDKRM